MSSTYVKMLQNRIKMDKKSGLNYILSIQYDIFSLVFDKNVVVGSFYENL